MIRVYDRFVFEQQWPLCITDAAVCLQDCCTALDRAFQERNTLRFCRRGINPLPVCSRILQEGDMLQRHMSHVTCLLHPFDVNLKEIPK